MIRLDLFRVFVAETDQKTIFSSSSSNKHNAFLQAFDVKKNLYFNHRGSSYVFVIRKRKDDEYLIGEIAKKTSTTIYQSPEEGFGNEIIDDWPRVPVVVNLSMDQRRGQAVAIGINGRVVKKPLELLRSLANRLSDSIRLAGYELSVNAISNEQDFWTVIGEYPGRIERVQFEIETPNLFGAADQFDKEMKEAGHEYQATSVGIGLENPEGKLKINRDEPFISRAVKYAADGGGSYCIKIKGISATIRSGEATQHYQMDEVELRTAEDGDIKDLERLCDRIFSCLDR